MRHGRNELFDALKHRFTAAGGWSRTGPAGRPQSRGTYRSSRDTAARTLRAEDDGSLGLPVDHRPDSTLLDYYARP